jgi:CheY-like chemotaxis protein
MEKRDDLSTIITADYPTSESKTIFCSVDGRYYDEIITRLRLQAIEKYQYYTPRHQQREKLRQQEEGEEKLHDPLTRKKRILLVDDEPDHCMVYQIVLEDTGYECTSYTDSVRALQEFKADYYDLVILDIRMPKLDGFALCEKIREVDREVQIIFITAGEAYYESFRKQYYPKISNDINISCLRKPIRNEELISMVNMTMVRKEEK